MSLMKLRDLALAGMLYIFPRERMRCKGGASRSQDSSSINVFALTRSGVSLPLVTRL